MFLSTHGILASSISQGGGGYLPLTTAWIAETGESDTTILTALNDLEQGMIDYSLTSKMLALYPFVGGSSTKHKYNFIDARDLDAAYRLIFSGGWTHSSTGALPNGIDAGANTFLGYANLSQNDLHFSYYSRTNRAGSVAAIMGLGYGGGVYTQLFARYTDNLQYVSVNDAGVYSTLSATNSQGLMGGVRNNSTEIKSFKNNTISGVTTASSLSFFIEPFYLGYIAGGVYDNLECAFSSIGLGLTDTDISNLYTIVQAFQTTLGRNV